MSENRIQPSSNGLKILFIIGLIGIVGFLAYQFWDSHQKAPSVATPTAKVSLSEITPQPNITREPGLIVKPSASVTSKPNVSSEPGSVIQEPMQTPTVIDFDKLGKDKALQARMDKRKQVYGVEKGIDMVVKPDETIKVGDVILPVREIEEQIRLSRGEIVESDIPSQNASPNESRLTPEEKKRLADQIHQRERKFAELEQQLRKLRTSENIPQYQEIETEYKKLSQTARMAETYRLLVADIEKETVAAEQGRANQTDESQDTLIELQAKKRELEKALHKHLATEESSNARAEEYGIYIVRPEDNIWNIHFRFLNGFLQKKGVTLSPLADEPIESGVSSGVGKLLKFSENMVYLYNLEKRKLDLNLNQLTPFKRIVIYNMNRVFELLDQIDYLNVNQIYFDGESIWIIRAQ